MKILVFCVALIAATACLLAPLFLRQGQIVPHAATAERAAQLVGDLIANRNRSTAICKLIALRRYHSTPGYEPEPCTSREVRHFIGSPTGDVFGVTLEVDYIDKVEDSPIAGELILFDREGFLIPVYHGAAVLTAADGVFEYRKGQLAIGHVINTSAGDQTSTQILSIVPLADPQRAVLRLILGPPLYEYVGCEGYYWSWQARDADGDGIADVEIGPNTNSSGEIEPRAVFRWSDKANGYVGPSASPSDGYVRLDTMPTDEKIKDDCCGSAASKEFAKSFPAASAPFSNFGVRRPICDPPVMQSIQFH